MKIQLFFKYFGLFLLNLLFILPAFSSQNIKDKKMSTRKCGDFELISESLDTFASDACRTDDGIGDKRYKTEEGNTLVHVSNQVLELSSSVGEVVDKVLLDLMRRKVQARFLKRREQIDFKGETTFYDAFIEMEKKILDDGKSTKRQIRKLFILFPDLEQEILKDNPDYKPLVCRYEVWKHNQKVIKGIALGLSIVELAALVAALPVAAPIVLAANLDRAILLSQLLMVGGVAGVVGGALQIENNIANWDQVTAAKNAKMLLKFYRKVENEIKLLKKEPEKNKDKILELKKWLPTEPELVQLKKTKSMAFKEYKSLFFGLSKVGVGVAMIYGGNELFEMISKFQKDSPASDPTSGSIDPPWMD